MPIAQTDLLKNLVHSLSKAEKRQFKVYCKRLGQSEELKFVKLFDIIASDPSLQDEGLKKKLQLQTTQLTNLKRHLYEQILKSLRLIYGKSDTTLRLREQFDYASILYRKGLRQPCFIILEKIKKTALELEEHVILLDVLELQKRIESRHITRSRRVKNKVENLMNQSDALRIQLSRRNKLANLSLKIQGLYIKMGFVKNERDLELYKTYFNDLKPTIAIKTLGLYEKVHLYQSLIWYHYVTLNFHFCYKHAIRWVEALDDHPAIKRNDPGLYIRGLHYGLTHAFYLNRPDKYKTLFQKFINHRKEQLIAYKETTRQLDFSYYQNAVLNNYIISNRYTQLSKTVTEITEGYSKYSSKIDSHRMHMFNYKIALCYSYTGRYEQALDYLNQIEKSRSEDIRQDVLVYARLMQLICHFQINNFTFVENTIDNVRLHFNNCQLSNKVIEVVLQFLKKASKAMNFGIDNDILKLQDQLKKLRSSQFDKIAFIYYDFYNWCGSILKNTTIEKVKKEI